MVGLPALMLSGEWQSRCIMLVCEHRYHPHATPIEPDYDSLIRNIHEYPSGGHFVGLWQCSCSSIHIGPNVSPTVGLMPYNGPIPSPGISSTLLRLCWEAQQTFLQQQIWMHHAGRAGWAAQPEWAASCCQEMTRALTKTKTRKKRNNRESWLCVLFRLLIGIIVLFPCCFFYQRRCISTTLTAPHGLLCIAFLDEVGTLLYAIKHYTGSTNHWTRALISFILSHSLACLFSPYCLSFCIYFFTHHFTIEFFSYSLQWCEINLSTRTRR